MESHPESSHGIRRLSHIFLDLEADLAKPTLEDTAARKVSSSLHGKANVRRRKVSKQESHSALSSHPGFVKQALAVAGMSLGCLLDGTVIAYSSPALPSLFKQNSPVHINLDHASWIGSVHTLGAVLGCLISVPTMSALGRRGAALYVMSLAYLLGYLLIGFAVNVEMIIIGRLLGGIGLGLTLSITPVYLVEIASVHNRGILGVIPPLFTQIGLFTTYLAGIWLEWSGLALSGVALIVPNVVFIWAIPESPVHLASKGKFCETEDALMRLGRHEDPTLFYKQIQGETFGSSSPDIYSDTTSTVSTSTSLSSSVSWRFYTHPAVWRPAMVCFAIMFFFQATGYNTIIAYTKLIFRESGLSLDENIATGITGGIILLSCAVALLLSKFLARKVLLLISASGTIVTLIMLGTYYYLKNTGDVADFSVLPLITILAFISFFMVGYGAVAWTVMAEILPSSARGRIYPAAVGFSWICNFGFAHSFGYIQTYLGSFSAFWTFAGLSCFGLVFIIFCIPETKDKSADEIAVFFVKRQDPVSNVTSVVDISDI